MLLVLGFVSCEKPEKVAVSDNVKLSFDNPIIGVSYESKAPINGDRFTTSNDAYPIGVWLMRGDTDEDIPQMNEFFNMRSRYLVLGGVGTWSFYPFGDDEKKKRSDIYIRKGLPVDIYAYYPWVNDVDSITEIPFVSGSDDWMVAGPVELDEGQTSEDITVPLPFKHIMTCIQVYIACRYTGTVVLASMTLNDSKNRLVAAGHFNCKTGEISGERTGSITITPNLSLTNPASAYIIMPEIDGLAQGELTLSFVFNRTQVEQPFELPLQMELQDGSRKTIEKFSKGYKYVYQLTLDNTMNFKPVGVETGWTDVDVPMPI